MSLLRALALQVSRDHDEAIFEQFRLAVEAAIAPFKPGPATVWFLEDSDNFFAGGRTICIEVGNLPRYVFKMALDRELLAYPEEVAQRIVEELFNHFRYRPTLPVDDNVRLGED